MAEITNIKGCWKYEGPTALEIAEVFRIGVTWTGFLDLSINPEKNLVVARGCSLTTGSFFAFEVELSKVDNLKREDWREIPPKDREGDLPLSPTGTFRTIKFKEASFVYPEKR